MRNLTNGPTPGRTGSTASPADIARLIDHTLLRPEAVPADLERLCAEALAHRFATVCVHASWVGHCRDVLGATAPGLVSVIGFPHGATLPLVKVREAELAQEAGATELDLVIQVGYLKAGRRRYVQEEVAAVARVRRPGVVLKVILETALLSDEEKVAGACLARDAGADFVKTSTGFGPGGATVEDVALLVRTVGPGVRVKASGGIRDLASLERMVAAGAARIGTSAGVHIMAEAAARAGASLARGEGTRGGEP